MRFVAIAVCGKSAVLNQLVGQSTQKTINCKLAFISMAVCWKKQHLES